MTMQPVVSISPAPIGAQAWLVLLVCGHTVPRRPPLPKGRAFCGICRDDGAPR